ncbi:hypothetical protein STCU_12373 [Strigomonas culicis]|uniref:Uncharacterized protein n=1 Tax=Strigomonas culicis TaxID=28005 RepID=S9TAP3_9TRYP|nr:hypothetical protein STCU_12373 [Strigomonas culicis]|eukprot:EPY15052.1 hypothetical protein STCU_12373 [Strigomonas culicis]
MALEDQLEGEPSTPATDRLTDEVGRARLMHAKLYTDLAYASGVAHERLERAVEEQWGGVAKVVQSRHAAVDERRRRLQEGRGGEPQQSKAYVEALQLLEKESRCKNLDKYRVSEDTARPTPTIKKQ